MKIGLSLHLIFSTTGFLHKRLFLLLCSTLFIVTSYAQTNNYYKPNAPNILPNSPNAASLGEFGKTPVSYYNGTTSISIPLYEINLNGLKIPISLSYNSSGIKVAQEASWTGLGWTLEAGGCITKQCNDGDDFVNRTNRTITPYFYASSTLKDILIKETSQIDPQQIIDNDDKISLMDTEPDIFYYNFCNYSGSLFFSNNDNTSSTTSGPHIHTAYIKSKKEYLKANFDETSWNINDGNGFEYQFGKAIASTETTYGSSTSYDNSFATLDSYRGVEFYNASSTAYYLDKVLAPNGDFVSFSYGQDTIYTVPQTLETYRLQLYNTNDGEQPINTYTSTVSNAMIIQSNLKHIDFKNGSIDFITVNNRADIESYGITKSPILSEMVINRDSNNVKVEYKRYKFYYSYLGDIQSNVSCRLMLDSIVEAKGNNLKNEKYQFTYNRGFLPKKNSRQIDFWGYYNNSQAPKLDVLKWNNVIAMDNEGTALPSYDFSNTPNSYNFDYFLGRSRISDKDMMQHGILTKITYPTGGSTEFAYEPHEFSTPIVMESSNVTTDSSIGLTFRTTSDSPNGQLLLLTTRNATNPYEVQPTTYTTASTIRKNSRVFIRFSISENCSIQTMAYATLNVTLSTTINGSVSQKNIYSSSLQNTTNDNTVVNFVVPDDGYLTYTITPSYNYVAQNVTTSTSNTKSLSVNAFIYHTYGKDSINYGGGLRVKEISDYTTSDNNKILAGHRIFTYKNSDGTSSGYLYAEPKTASSFIEQVVVHRLFTADGQRVNSAPPGIPVYDDPKINSLNRIQFQSSPFSTSSLYTPTVGYGSVEEKYDQVNTNGRTLYSYNIQYNDRSASFPSNKVVALSYNGLPKSIAKYNSNNSPIEEVDFDYVSDASIQTESRGFSKYQKFPWFGNVLSQLYPLNVQHRTTPIFMYDIYSLKTEWWKKTTETHKNFFNNGGDVVVSVINYEYDPINYLSNKTTTTSSNAERIEERLTYSDNDALMSAQNKVNFLFTKSKYVDNNPIESVNTNYNNFNLGSVSTSLPSIVQYRTGSSTYKNYIEYLGYDVCGNPREILENNLGVTTYLWSYNGQYPIFEIKNASYADVKSALSYTDAQVASLTLNSIPDVTGLRSKLDGYFKDRQVLISSYTYKPLLGTSTKTDQNGITTYYDYDSFNRLKHIKDKDGNIVQKIDYNYQH